MIAAAEGYLSAESVLLLEARRRQQGIADVGPTGAGRVLRSLADAREAHQTSEVGVHETGRSSLPDLRMPLLPNVRVQFTSSMSPERIRERLDAAGSEGRALANPEDEPVPQFRGGVSGDDFEFQLRKGTRLGPRPMVRGTIGEWQGRVSVDAEVSVSGGFAVETTLAVAVLLSLVGGPVSGLWLAVLGATAFAVVQLSRRNVAIGAAAFRHELSDLIGGGDPSDHAASPSDG